MKKILWNDNWTFQAENSSPIPVDLPHDAMQWQGRASDAPSGNNGAHYLGGKYRYEKTLILSEHEASGTVQIQFDGIYRNALVFINGKQTNSSPYGYLPFLADGTGLVHPGKNTVRVEVDNHDQPNSRWYSGSGIYRSVWLWTGASSHIQPWGIQVSTRSLAPAIIQVSVDHCGGEVSVEVFDKDDLVAQALGDCVEIVIPQAKTWSAESPYLYRCHVKLLQDGEVVDEADQSFGIRTLRYDTTGFYVNGQRTMLQGGCIHHDNGILGACSIPEAEERRLKILKNAGYNAIRCAHNPASSDLLDACDKLGIYVMEEMWDMWYQRKNKYDYGVDFLDHWQDDVATVVARDFTHPCVIMYSIGNEVTEPHNEEGIQQGKEIVQLFHQLDQTRPTTIGLNMALVAMSAMGFGLYDNADSPVQEQAPAVNSTVFNETVSRNNNLVMASCNEEVDQLTSPILDAVDIAGYNYGAPRYPLDAVKHPHRVVVGSETFPHQLADTWESMKQCPYVIGDFMWTAWDYIGECSIGAWSNAEDALAFSKPYPWKLADVGAFDILGNPTGEALWASAVWSGKTSIGVRPVPYPSSSLARGAWRGTNAVPSWSWTGCDGMQAEIEVYTPGVETELYINGSFIERKPVAHMLASFTAAYAPGKLEAISYDKSGSKCGYACLATANEDLHWNIDCEAKELYAGQIAFFPIQLEDSNGTVESNRDTTLNIHLSGGKLLSFGSAAPRTKAEFSEGTYPSYFGRAMAVIKTENAEILSVSLTTSQGQVAEKHFAILPEKK